MRILVAVVILEVLAAPLSAQKQLHSNHLGLNVPRLADSDTAFPALCHSAMVRVDTLLRKGYRKARRYRTTAPDRHGRFYAVWSTEYGGLPMTVVFSWDPATGDCQSEVAYAKDTYDTLMLIHSAPSTRDNPRNLYSPGDTLTGLPVLPDTALRPRVLRFPEPPYPPMLQQQGIGGKVVLDFVVDPTGHVEPRSVRVVSSSHLAFEPVAIGAARDAVLSPGYAGGRPVRVLVRQTIIFSTP